VCTVLFLRNSTVHISAPSNIASEAVFELVVQRGTSGGVSALAMTADAHIVAACDVTGEVVLIDTRLRSVVRAFRPEPERRYDEASIAFGSSGCTAVALSHNGALLAVAISEGGLSVWNVATGAKVHEIPRIGRIGSLTFSPDHRYLAAAEDRLVVVRQLSSWTVTGRIPYKASPISHAHSIAFTPSNELLISDRSGLITRWPSESATTAPERETVDAIDISADASAVAVLGRHSTSVYDIGTWRELTRVNSSAVTARVAPRGTHLALLHMADAEIIDVSGSAKPFRVDGKSTAAEFSHDGDTVVIGQADGTLITLSREDAAWRERLRLVGTARNDIERFHAVLTPHASSLSAATSDGRVRTWALSEGGSHGATVTTAAYHRVRFADDGRHFVAADETGALVRGTLVAENRWDIESVPGCDDWGCSRSLAISSDGALIAADGGKPFLFDARTRNELDVPTVGTAEEITAMAFAPDKHRLYIGTAFGELFSVELQPPYRRQQLVASQGEEAAGYGIRHIAVAPDARHVATISFADHLMLLDGTSRTRTFAGTHSVGSAQFIGSRLYASLDDSDIARWDVISGDVQVLAVGHQQATAFAISGDDQWMVAAGNEGFLRLTPWGRPANITIIPIEGSPDYVAMARNGLFDGTSDALSLVSWRISGSVVPLEALYTDFFEPGLLQKLRAGELPQPPRDLAVALRLPSLRVMSRAGLAHIERRGQTAYLCVASNPRTGGVAQLRLFARGQTRSVDPHGFTFDPKDPWCTYRKPLPPDLMNVPLEVADVRPRKKVAIKTPALDTKRSGTGTLHVLTMAIDEYPQNCRYGRLQYAVADADAVVQLFQTKERVAGMFGAVRVWPDPAGTVPPLRNSTATKAAFEQQLAALAAAVRPSDTVFLFLAGHGRVPPGYEMFYFIPSFATLPNCELDPLSDRTVGISSARLADAVRSLRARNVIIMIDACQSGGTLESLEKIGRVKADFQHPGADVGMYVIAAATPLQAAQEARTYGHGVLTEAFLRAVAAPSPRRSKSVRELIHSMRGTVPLLAGKVDEAQTLLTIEVGPDISLIATARR
jgi:WD40 repeat protein